MSWRDSNQTKVIVCNNNKASYYRDPIGGTVFIRKDFLDQYVKDHPLKHFAFAERYIKETGFADVYEHFLCPCHTAGRRE